MDEMDSHVSLLDLSAQFPFEMDDLAKKEICFSETLVISCAHNDVDLEGEFSDSEWSCAETESESEEIKDETCFEVKDKVEEEAKEEQEVEEENDFHFFFFPDCSKPIAPQNSKDSVLMVDGMPKKNPANILPKICTCLVDKHSECSCFIKLPCHCGAKKLRECKCGELDTVCICREELPATVCVCKSTDVCVCHPDYKIRATCTCGDITKPCVCDASKFPYPVCTCKHKPKYKIDTKKKTELGEQMGEEFTEQVPENVEEESVHVPCECQKPEPLPRCMCRKGKNCTCLEKSCVCGIQKSCICDSDSQEDTICKSDDSKTVCSCPEVRLCTCGETPDNCQCFPKPECTCGDPENCKCFLPCVCEDPCVCDTIQKPPDVCVCSDTITCTCSGKKGKKRPKQLRRFRAGKHGFRWCHTVDPKHTFFDYGYGRHNKISEKEQLQEKFKILGLHDDKKDDEVCEVHGVEAPPYKKHVRKPSIDCCSAVGGISISVETLGEDKDKFLVQVVSHSAKEGANTGSKLVSILDANLHTMEENRNEHIAKRDIIKERRSYMAICESGYYNKTTRICGERKVVKRLYHGFDDAREFLLEGANVVLLRYFSINRYRGNVKTRTVLMDGTICESIYEMITAGVYPPKLCVFRLTYATAELTSLLDAAHDSLHFCLLRHNIRHLSTIDSIAAKLIRDVLMKFYWLTKTYLVLSSHSTVLVESWLNNMGLMRTKSWGTVCHGVSQAIVNGKPFFVCKVERHIIEPSGFVHQTLTVLSLRGYIVSHEWADNNYIMHVNPLLEVVPERDEIEQHAPLRENWRDDLQLFSDYLDFKSARTSEGGRYVIESGGLTGTVKDYLQALLLLRPQDALHFTRHYFGSTLSALDLPYDEYFDASAKHVRYYFFED